ncbi:MAG TPA: oligosaccharide flippase family protein [Gaiellaceae bacterium]|nr:oligosaccharide flippase family protein [Gaiellaceae bacterium]HEX2496887.1 oligosaccharide flippase family protein [Gaiellaceae bacterium]
MSLGKRLGELARHSAVYGVGSLVSRFIAVLLLPVYTRYLSPADYGLIETLIALSAVLTVLLAAGVKSAFFRFYFDEADEAGKRRVIRTSFWFTMATGTAGLAAGIVLAGPISELLFRTSEHADLVRAAFVGLWAHVNYEQMTSLFRVEQRSVAYLIATLINLGLTVGATLLLVVVLEEGPIGVIVGNFTGTLLVYAGLLAYRREQLGLEWDRPLLREMNRFGMPLVPSALFLWAMNFSDRFFLVRLSGAREVGLYAIGVRLASAIILLLAAFRTAWPAFAYSIEDDREAARTYAYVLTYLVALTSWMALGLGVLAPWLVRLLTTEDFYEADRVVAPLAFAAVLFGAYIVIVIGIGRARRTRSNWIITGTAAVASVAVNLVLIPEFGMIGAAIAGLTAYAILFLGMAWKAQQVFPVPYQWRRVATAIGVAVALTVIGRALEPPLAAAIAIVACYPLALLPFGFYLPEELRRLRVITMPSR